MAIFSSNATASSKRQEDGFNDLPLLETLPRLLNSLRIKLRKKNSLRTRFYLIWPPSTISVISSANLLLCTLAQAVKSSTAIQETEETWIQSLGWEDPLEEEMATHTSILVWKIPWTEDPDGLQSVGL